MKLFYIVTSLLFTVFCNAQESIRTSELYTSKGITHKESDNSIFTGIAESRRKNGHLVFMKEYNNGYETKYTLFYNTDEKIISSETFYYDNSTIKKRHISYPNSGTLKTITDYDENGKKSLVEQFVDGKLIYHCEYQNGKKNGTIFYIDENNLKSTYQYENGRKTSSSEEPVNIR